MTCRELAGVRTVKCPKIKLYVTFLKCFHPNINEIEKGDKQLKLL